MTGLFLGGNKKAINREFIAFKLFNVLNKLSYFLVHKNLIRQIR